MTVLLEKAIHAAKSVSPEMQDDMARMMLSVLEMESPTVELSDDEMQDLHISEAAEADGDFATDAEVAAVWAAFSK